MRAIRDTGDVLHIDPDQVLAIASEFYEDLFTADPVTVQIVEAREQIWAVTHSRVTEDMCYHLMAPFTVDELRDETVMDEFVIAHALGWWGKAIMIRNEAVLWILSIGFEMMEVTFRHVLPNFNECWWDSVILDVLICNWLGIWAGMQTVRYFDGKTYEWVGLSLQPNILGKVKRSLSQFTPAYWDKDEWEIWSGPVRFVQILGLVIVILTVELNAFFLKYCLWVPPSNPLNTYRLVIWWLIANPAIREYNAYLQDRKPIKKMGAFAWLSLAICLVEVLICIKFGQDLYPEPMPKWVFSFWLLFGLAFLCFLLLWSYKLYYKRQLNTGDLNVIQMKKVT
ncbi:hypothetical protein L7F22_042802 [Adiantum nelumboides]|nr:hypothetical protein [Adiantum nelumboides]